jgi:predicted NBD/HSP70 family sugar kinase
VGHWAWHDHKWKTVQGDNGFAGEFSHIPLFLNNKICDCGKSGCLETEPSLYVMAEKAVKGLDANKPTQLKDLSLDHLQETTSKILSAAMRGDKFRCRAAFRYCL